MSRQISMFMQLSWFVLVFKERYFIKHVTHILVYFRVFSLTMISQNLLCLFESLRFFNVMSNINVHATLMICISLWRKVFHHGDWFRRWLILYWVKKKSNTCLKSCVWIFSTKTNNYSFYHDSHEWFLMFWERIYQSFSLAWLE